MRRVLILVACVALAASACAGPDSAAHLLEEEPVGGASLPPVTMPPIPTTSTTTTTTVPPSPVDPEEADRAAQSDLRSALVAARAIFADRGTYDASLADVAEFAPEVQFIDLTEAYASTGVVYDAHDQRVTLHRRSDSGRWFCIDESTRNGTDFGFGDTFEDSLATCGDGTQRNDWSSAFGGQGGYEPIGPDEAAILHAFERFADAVDQADHEALRATLFESTGCRPDELKAFWPEGLDLFDSVSFAIDEITVEEGTARVSVSILDETISRWPMIRYGVDWYHNYNPCLLLKEKAVVPQNLAAQDLLTSAHIATQTAFVRSENFNLSLDALNAVDPSVTFVTSAETAYGLVGYIGSREYGLMITEGQPGRFYCMVEYLRQNTGYGVGESFEEVGSASACNQSTEGWPVAEQ